MGVRCHVTAAFKLLSGIRMAERACLTGHHTDYNVQTLAPNDVKQVTVPRMEVFWPQFGTAVGEIGFMKFPSRLVTTQILHVNMHPFTHTFID